MIDPGAYGYPVWKCPLCQQVILERSRDEHQALLCPVRREQVIARFATELASMFSVPASFLSRPR